MEKGVYTMTKKEAIEYLQKNKPTSGFEGLAEAVDMAIESLQELGVKTVFSKDGWNSGYNQISFS